VQSRPNLLGDALISSFIASSDGDVLPLLSNLVAVPSRVDVKRSCKASCKRIPIVFFGGNGCDMYLTGAIANQVLAPIAVELHKQDFFLQSFSSAYRGYPGNNDNWDDWTSRRSVTSDGTDLIDVALQNLTGDTEGRVVLAGWSMGAAVALQVAQANPHRVAGLFLVSPWSTLWDETNVMIHKFAGSVGTRMLAPWAWALNLDPWDSLSAVSRLPTAVPLAVISPLSDQIIPSSQHRQVHDSAAATTKAFVPVGNAGHENFPRMVSAIQRELHSGGKMHTWVDATVGLASMAVLPSSS